MATCSQPGRSQTVLRPIDNGDEQFLFEVYASTRLEELALTGWDHAQRQAFLRMQFDAQARQYRSEYSGADFAIIEVQGQPAGRLFLHRRAKEIRIMDIALMPAYRRRGIGTELLRQVLEEGTRQGKTVSIHVEVFNPAATLYQRLGFKPVATRGLYQLMEWTPTKFEQRTTEEYRGAPTLIPQRND